MPPSSSGIEIAGPYSPSSSLKNPEVNKALFLGGVVLGGVQVCLDLHDFFNFYYEGFMEMDHGKFCRKNVADGYILIGIDLILGGRGSMSSSTN